MPKQFPHQPNLRHLKNQAKQLVKAHQSALPAAAKRIKAHLPRLANLSAANILSANFPLQEAQCVIAREYGFDSWSKLTAAVLAAEQASSPPETIDYNAWHKAAWDEIHQFLEKVETNEEFFGPKNPQHRFAPEFFRYYLDNRPSQPAEHALGTVFTMWSNLRGASKQAEEALKQISYEEDLWGEVSGSLLRIFSQDDRADEGLALLEDLAQKVIPLKSRSALLFEFSRSLLDRGETEKGHQGFVQVVEWDASEWHVKQARGYIYQFENLNIGQPAPHFRLQDIDGHWVDLADYVGKIVILHFWGTTCGFCKMVYPHLRQMAQEFPGDHLGIIGVSDDRDFAALRAQREEEELTWPQICEGKGWDDTVYKLYNVTSLPTEYIIDQSGSITHKIVGGDRGEELIEAVRSLIALKNS